MAGEARPNARERKTLERFCGDMPEAESALAGAGVKTLAALVERGWIEAGYDADQECRTYVLTAAGEAALDAG